ncbi:hypothetical protein [Microbacterium sp. Se63.02b]|uniref:hypothetical protein n=1 Tax=Microbacterium sp. Se63.02b TaxID=2709304 RepID=UPI001604FBCC|nr:hypothetical protein [Microbacterium sp. Se63.02b]QNA91530.1 hypothetical protein G4G29_02075 [Microbacterium sp. Se63.02b]
MAAADAMRHAKAQYAFASAARFGELVLELWPLVPDAAVAARVERLDLLLVLGSVLRNAGDGERALAVANVALAEVDPATVDPRLHARLLRNKALYLVNLGRLGAIRYCNRRWRSPRSTSMTRPFTPSCSISSPAAA